MAVQVSTIPAISFRLRSPYSIPNMGLPPAGQPAGGAPVSLDAQGNPVVAGVTLTPYTSNTPGPNQPVQATFDQGAYGDLQSIVVNFPGAGPSVDGDGNPEVYCLDRPSNQRTQLLIQNNTLGPLYYAFDRQADNVTCIGIAAGGSREFDTRIPQGKLSLYSLGNGTAVVEFMNNDVT